MNSAERIERLTLLSSESPKSKPPVVPLSSPLPGVNVFWPLMKSTTSLYALTKESIWERTASRSGSIVIVASPLSVSARTSIVMPTRTSLKEFVERRTVSPSITAMASLPTVMLLALVASPFASGAE